MIFFSLAVGGCRLYIFWIKCGRWNVRCLKTFVNKVLT
jgi:hypothetical protein